MQEELGGFPQSGSLASDVLFILADSITQSSEALQEEQLKLEAQNDQLLAQRA